MPNISVVRQHANVPGILIFRSVAGFKKMACRLQRAALLVLFCMLGTMSPRVQAQAPTANSIMSIINLILDDDDSADGAPGSGGGEDGAGGGAGSGGITPGSGGSGGGGETGAQDLLAVNITPPHLANAEAGTLPGALSVSRDGAATYSLPLSLPPGTAGLQPQLSLNYASTGANGLLGLGWSLGGTSTIQRCGQTIAQDKGNDRINFSNTDRLCLDGQRLVLVNLLLSDDNYWSTSAEYRTELESFSRIRTVMINGQRTFTVESKDGQILTYGSGTAYINPVLGTPHKGTFVYDPISKSGAGGWALAEANDRSGNFIRYSYDQDQITGEFRIASIRYGGKGRSAHAGVEFTYQARTDAWMRYLDETRIDVRNRLVAITSFVGDNLDGVLTTGAWVQKYSLSYEYSPTSGRSMLNRISACARNPETGASDCLPATSFSWGKPDASKSPGFVSSGFWNGPLLTTVNLSRVAEFKTGAAGLHPDYFAFTDFENHGLTDVLEKRVASPISANPDSPDRFKLDLHNPLPRGTLRNQYRYFHNTGSNFVEYKYNISLNGANVDFAVLEIGDFNGDGSPDLLAATKNSGTKICLSPLATPVGLPRPGQVITFTCTDRPTVGSNKELDWPTIVDIDGDGRSEHYGPYADGRATLCSASSCVVDYNPPVAYLSAGIQALQEPVHEWRDYLAFTQMVDFGGVGRPFDVRWNQPFLYMDVDTDGSPSNIYRWLNSRAQIEISDLGRGVGFEPYVYPAGPEPCTTSLACTPFMFDYAAPGAGLAGDFNGSGYSSVTFGYSGLRSSGYSMNPPDFTVCLSTGRSLDCRVRKKHSGDNYLSPIAVGDYVGDGAPAILALSATLLPQGPIRNGKMSVCRLTGDDSTDGTSANDNNMYCTPWSGSYSNAANTGALHDQMFFMDLLGTGRTQLMQYHGGKVVNSKWQEDGRWELFVPVDVARENEALDRIVSVTNGLGATSRVEYREGVAGGVVSLSNSAVSSYPVRVGRAPGKVVSRLLLDNGSSAVRSTKYEYADPAIDLSGRGSLGFATVAMHDEQTGIVTTTSYAQGWPYSGMMTGQTTYKNNVLLQKIKHELGEQRIAQANGASTSFPYSKLVTVSRFDLDANDLGTVKTENTYGDDWGNLTERFLETSLGSEPEKKYTTKNSTTYSNDSTTWLLGLSTDVSETRSDPVAGALTRSIKKKYDAISGLLSEEEIEPDNNVYARKVTYDRTTNTFGLVGKRTETWVDPYDGVSKSRAVSTTYDAAGRFAISGTNPLGHAESVTYQPGTGAKLSLTNANGVKTIWTVDGFGRIQKQVDADGSETRRYFKACAGDCPAGTVAAEVVERFNGNDRVAVPQVSYSDSAGRILQTRTWGFDGRVIITEQTFDSLGRPEKNYWPRFDGERTLLQRAITYDVLNRPVTQETADETGVQRSATTRYVGLWTISTNEKQQVRQELKNVAGTLAQTVDSAQGVTSFTYDAFGNLLTTTDPVGNKVSITYDLLGRRTDLNDPDLGWIRYDVDPIGRVWKTTSPNQRALKTYTRTVFDQLDRMVDRYESELDSHWIYDTAAGGVGQLAEANTGTATAKDYRRMHTYDSYGRPTQTTQVINNDTFVSTPELDKWGRLSRQKYRRNTDAEKVFDYRYNSKGYVTGIERSGLALWSVRSQDAAHRVLEAQLGNGLQYSRSYYDYTGLPKSVVLKAADGASRLEENYTFDALGNVDLRSQYWDGQSQGFSELFSYDVLNRLEASTVNGQAMQRITYDAGGNINTKGNVSSQPYQYPAPGSSRPHGVTSIGGYGAFTYDANGNQQSAPGRTASWTSFDMPLTMTKGAVTQSYVYGSEHQRLRMNRADDGSTIVYGGAQEVELKGGVVERIKTYWPNGIGLEIDKPGSATELLWTHADRLGSVIALSDAAGSLRERMAYDAWGKRRSLDGANTPDSLDGKVDHRGFTGHEMLDQLDLVHMNGRVYDPLVARFLSADPLIQDPMNGQSYNRYTYVFNNPTNLTDPTGFASDPAKDAITKDARNYCSSIGMGTSCVTKVVSAVMQFLQENPGVILATTSGVVSHSGLKISKNPEGGAATPDARFGTIAEGAGKKSASSGTSWYDNPGLTGAANSQRAAERRASYWGGFFGGEYSVMDPDGVAGHKHGENLGLALDVGAVAAPFFRGLSWLRGLRAARGGEDAIGNFLPAITNRAGGTVHLANGPIDQTDIARIVAGARGNVNILSGVHGMKSGETIAHFPFYAEDLTKFGDIPGLRVFDFSKLSKREIHSIVNGQGTTIGGFCFSCKRLDQVVK